ncbi:MAG: hypothetical protein AAF690_17425 [Acidobacteriota bacterium]
MSSEKPSSSPPDAPPSRFGWPHAVATLGLLLVLGVLGVTALTLRSAERGGQALVATGERVLDSAIDLAEAFRTGSTTTSFRSYATEINSQSYLQFSTLDQLEQFERTDEASVFWGQLELPDVVVQVTAPVQTSYYLDLDEEWLFELDGDTVRVVAPQIRFNRPAVDVSRLEWNVKEESLFRDEEPVRAALRDGLTEMAADRARDNVGLVREIGRRRAEAFVRQWLLNTFAEEPDDRAIELVFRDEASPFPDLGVVSVEAESSDGG